MQIFWYSSLQFFLTPYQGILIYIMGHHCLQFKAHESHKDCRTVHTIGHDGHVFVMGLYDPLQQINKNKLYCIPVPHKGILYTSVGLLVWIKKNTYTLCIKLYTQSTLLKQRPNSDHRTIKMILLSTMMGHYVEEA